MTTHLSNKFIGRTAAVVALTSILAACGSDNDSSPVAQPAPVPPAPVMVSYDVTVLNLTNAQPISPIAVTLQAEERLWSIGSPASEPLAVMAESGDNSGLLALDSVLASTTGENPLPPGGSMTLTVTIEDNSEALISVAGMLVNTNDAFVGITGWSTASLEVGDSRTFNAPVYDAGTEYNTEAAGTIPGPVDGGEGVSEGREEFDAVARHPGVVSADDGLSSSILSVQHKFDNPAMRITITRTE